jgi:hypothetical protein
MGRNFQASVRDRRERGPQQEIRELSNAEPIRACLLRQQLGRITEQDKGLMDSFGLAPGLLVAGSRQSLQRIGRDGAGGRKERFRARRKGLLGR